MPVLVLTQTTVSVGHLALASASVLNSPAPVAVAAGAIGFGAAAAGAAGGGVAGAAAAGAGAAAGAAAAGGIVSVPARQAAMKSFFFWPDALIASLFAEYSALHSLALLPLAASVGAGAGAAGAGAAAGAAAGVAAPPFAPCCCWRHWVRNCCQVMPLVVPLALACFHWSPQIFITLSALAAPVPARPRAAARMTAEKAILMVRLVKACSLVRPPLHA